MNIVKDVSADRNTAKKFFICMICGCPRRELDTQRIYSYFIANGMVFSKNYKETDWLVLVTCAFIREVEDWSIYQIKYFLKHKPKNSRIVLTGCLPKINPGRLKELGEFEVLSPRELDKFDGIVKGKVRFADIRDSYEKPGFSLLADDYISFYTLRNILFHFELSKTFFLKCFFWLRKTVKILGALKVKLPDHICPDYYLDPREMLIIRVARGCIGACSYCVIRFANGRIESKLKDEIINEFKAGLKRGYKKFVLIAEDTGAYGIDSHSSIIELLNEVFIIEGDYKLILDDIHPQWLIKYCDDLVRIFSKHHSKIDFIISPVQAGSDRVLRLMRRPYKIDSLKDCLKRLQAEVSNLKIKTHIIVGFPGETEEDFEKTKELCREFRFFNVRIFGYTDRPNTEASKMSGKIPQKIINKRIKRLIEDIEAFAKEPRR